MEDMVSTNTTITITDTAEDRAFTADHPAGWRYATVVDGVVADLAALGYRVSTDRALQWKYLLATARRV